MDLGSEPRMIGSHQHTVAPFTGTLPRKIAHDRPRLNLPEPLRRLLRSLALAVTAAGASTLTHLDRAAAMGDRLFVVLGVMVAGTTVLLAGAEAVVRFIALRHEAAKLRRMEAEIAAERA
jgi:hypothetical protein